MTRANRRRAPKRRKLDEKARKAAMENLLGSYGSSDSGQEQLENAIEVLGEYAESDEEQDRSGDTTTPKLENEAEDEDEGLLSGSDEEPGPIDYAALLDMIHQTKGHQDDDDELDWGDGEDDVDSGN